MNFQLYKLISKYRFILPILVLGVFLVSFNFTHANDVFDGMKLFLANTLVRVIISALGTVLGWAGMFLNWTMQPQPIINSTLVQVGWTITRDFANMLFILILLGIALDFIMFNSFGVKKSIPTLILVALLINFSLPLAGVLIDFGNVVTNFFLSKISSDGNSFSETLANNVNLASILDFRKDLTSDEIKGEIANQVFYTGVFAIFFMVGTIFVFLALSLMFLTRYAYLCALLILLPIVLVLWAFPPTASHYNKWMGKYMQWTMFGPACAFFLYLSMMTLQGTMNQSITNIISGSGITGDKTSIITFLYTFVVSWFLMLASMGVANEMGVASKTVGLAALEKGAKWARGKMWQGTKNVAGATASRAGLTKGLDNTANAVSKWVPSMLGGAFAARQLRRGSIAMQETAKKQGALSDKETKSYEKMTDDQLRAELNDAKKSKMPYADYKVAQIEAMLSKRKGNALFVKDKDGRRDDTATAKLRRDAFDRASKYKDKSIMDAIKLDPSVKMYEIEKKYGSDESKIISGKTKREALNDLAENFSSKDVEETYDDFWKTTEGRKLLRLMIEQKGAASTHIRAAVENGKEEFTKGLAAEIFNTKNFTFNKKEYDYRTNGEFDYSKFIEHNTGLANYLISIPAIEYLGYFGEGFKDVIDKARVTEEARKRKKTREIKNKIQEEARRDVGGQ